MSPKTVAFLTSILPNRSLKMLHVRSHQTQLRLPNASPWARVATIDTLQVARSCHACLHAQANGYLCVMSKILDGFEVSIVVAYYTNPFPPLHHPGNTCCACLGLSCGRRCRASGNRLGVSGSPLDIAVLLLLSGDTKMTSHTM